MLMVFLFALFMCSCVMLGSMAQSWLAFFWQLTLGLAYWGFWMEIGKK